MMTLIKVDDNYINPEAVDAVEPCGDGGSRIVLRGGRGIFAKADPDTLVADMSDRLRSWQ